MIKKEKYVYLMECMKYGFDICFEDDSPNIEFEISNNQAGSIIGTKGENIKKLRKNYDCNIIITCVNKRRYLCLSGIEKFKAFGKIIYHL